MDRRRFTPRAEGLDPRLLLSGNSAALSNLHQKTIRIENLGKVLDQLQPGYNVPKNLVAPLQADLFALVGRLTPANSTALVNVELEFRSALAGYSITTQDVAALSSTFQTALQTTGAPQSVVDDMVHNMNNLVKYDSTIANPIILAANDYAVVLQTALGVGRPIKLPAAPTLSPSDASGPKGGHVTTSTQPRLVGHYDTDATIRLLDENFIVIGTAAVTANGQYIVKPVLPLSIGVHHLSVQAIDSNGDHSPPSPFFKLIVRAPRPSKHVTATAAGSSSGGLLGQ